MIFVVFEFKLKILGVKIGPTNKHIYN
jgi:hypothetical protein